jgi:asparagine synthase (glutamine-hydrolysing)
VARIYSQISAGLSPEFGRESGGCDGVLLDGRIFNAAYLGDSLGLEPGHEPQLLLHAYRRWGAEFPKYLEGEFAFALWDGHARRLLLGRDPSGYRPLFYTQQSGNIRFASDVRSLLMLPGARIRPNERHIAHWLALIPAAANSTFFEDIFRLPPGHTLLFENGRIALNAYWQPENLPLLHLRDSRGYADGLREVLERCVGDHLAPGSAAGSQLSGGLDSSSVTALAAGLLKKENRRLLAFTAVPEYPERAVNPLGHFSDEGPNAAAVAAQYPNVEHILVRHGSHSTFSMIDRFSSAQQEPIFNPANYNWFHEICLRARQRGVETLQLGAGGNMTISYHGAPALLELARQGRLWEVARLAQDLRRQGTQWRSVAHGLFRQWIPVWASHSVDYVRRGFSRPPESLIRPQFARSHGLDFMTRERVVHHLDSRAHRLSLLRRADLGASIHAFRQLSGVWMTDPTVDRRVIEYCLSVPVEYFCEGGIPRSLIRNAMVGRLPEQVRTERRKGVQAADFGEHFRAERPEALTELGRLRRVDLAVRSLDLPEMEGLLQWPEAQIREQGGAVYYWPKLLRALSLGRFLRRMEDGTLLLDEERQRVRTANVSVNP